MNTYNKLDQIGTSPLDAVYCTVKWYAHISPKISHLLYYTTLHRNIFTGFIEIEYWVHPTKSS